MSPALLVLAVLFAIGGFQEARRFQRQYGETPWRWDPWVWAVVMFLSWVIGIILLAIAERQGRNRAARQPAYSGGYVPQVPVQGYGQPGYGTGYGQPDYSRQGYGQPAVAIAASTASPFGIAETAATTTTAYGTQPAAAAAAATALPAAMWAADPTGRHQYRWWDGATWTANVATNGVVGQDPV